MSARDNSGPRTRRVRHQAATAGSPLFDLLAITGLLVASLGCVFLFGGPALRFSGPFLGLAALVYAACCIRTLRVGNGLALPLPPGAVWVALLFAYVSLRAVVAPLVPFQVFSEALHLAVFGFTYVAAAALGDRRRIWRVVLGAVLLFLSAQACYAISLHVRESTEVLWRLRPPSYGLRASGTFACPNHFAQVLQLGIVLSVALWLNTASGIALKLVATYTVLVSLPALLLSQSRSGWIGTVVGVAVVVFLAAARKGLRRAILTAVLIPVVVATIFLALWWSSELFQVRVREAVRHDIRYEALWPDTVRMIGEQGGWGSGPGTFRHTFQQYRFHFSRAELYLRYAHNEFLHVLAEYGWPGFALVVGGFLALAWRLVRRALGSESSDVGLRYTAMAGILAAATAHAVFDYNAHMAGNMLLLAVVGGVLYGSTLSKEGSGDARHCPRSRGFLLGTAAASLVTVGALVPLTLGDHVEERLLQHQRDGAQAEALQDARLLTRVSPWLWRGHRVLGDQAFQDAFWCRDPALRAEYVQTARQHYLRALRWNRLDRMALVGLARVDELEGRPADEVLARFDAVLRLDPFSVQAHIQYGLALKRYGRYAEALVVFQDASRLLRGKRNRQVELNLQDLKRRVARK